jgi:hypothetical protein
MDEHIMKEFGLSRQQFDRLLAALQGRLGVQSIEDVAFLSHEELYAGMDRWESAAVKRIFDIVTAHVGIEKLHRLTPTKRQRVGA